MQGVSFACKKVAKTYYVKCGCGEEITGLSELQVINAARQQGWVYDEDEDVFYCPACYEELKWDSEKGWHK